MSDNRIIKIITDTGKDVRTGEDAETSLKKIPRVDNPAFKAEVERKIRTSKPKE